MKKFVVICIALCAAATLLFAQPKPSLSDTFFGVNDPRYPPDAQNQRRRNMRDALVDVVSDAFRGGQLDPKDPTAGMGGTAQHLAAALNSQADLGMLIRHQGPPEDLAVQYNNYYAKLTQGYESQLRQQILASPGRLTPADVMRMALSATNGNYTLATMTAHNFLKNVTYLGRALTAQQVFIPANKDAREIAQIVAKLENLRGEPGAADKMGPWYHGFGVLFISSLVGRPGGTTLTDAEHFTRLFGLGGSHVDKEKMAWDTEMILALRRIHNLIYDEKAPKPDQLNPQKLQECQTLLAQVRQLIAAGDLKAAQPALTQVQKQCSGLTPNTAAGLDEVRLAFQRAVENIIERAKTERDNCRYKEALQLAEEAEKFLPNLSWLTTNMQLLRKQTAAQEAARQELRPGLEAVQRKDLDGAINAIRRAQQIPNAQDIPPCLREQMQKLLAELENHKKFIKLTEQVEDATRKCDYKEAVRVVGEITRLNPREQFMSDWINTNVPKLAELQNKERQALDLIRQAEASIVQAETVANTEPVDTSRVAALIQQTRRLLSQANQEAPKCLPQRQQIVQIQQRCDALANRKKPEIAASIALLIDTSGSMADNNKINQAKDAARRAARQASKTTEIAILHFDGGCSPASMRPATGFTTDVNVLLAAIDKLQPGGGTPMYIATAAAVEYAQKHGRGKQRTVVLMSDGGDSCRDQQAQAAASIRASNIPVSTIGFDVGNNQQAQGDLGNLATMTGGRTFSASAADPREIIRAFNLAMLPSLLKDFDIGNAASNVAGYFSQAKTMVQQQNVSGALMLLQQANNLAPNSPNLNFNLSLLYESEDQLIPAMNHANNYLRLAPTAIDRADVENRITQMQTELQRNPRVVMDSSGCRDVLGWAQTEQDVAKRGRDVARRQAVLEVMIAAQRGECENARKLQASYKQRFGGQ
jgi:Mg-chelatase subunit ChlD